MKFKRKANWKQRGSAANPHMPNEIDYRQIAKRMLKLTHHEIGAHGRIIDQLGPKPTRKEVIRSTLEYGMPYKLRKDIIISVLDEVKGTRGFGRFKGM